MLCRKGLVFGLGLLFAAAVCATVPARAADFSLTPSVSQEVRYNDNVFLDSSQQTRDFISYTVGGLRMLDRTERLNVDITGKVAQFLYKDSTSLNSTDFLGNGTVRYSLTPKLSLSGRGDYSRDSQPDREIEVTGLALTGVRREHYTLGATSDYAFTEKTLASLSYDHGADNYDTATTARRSDVTWDTATLAFQHDLTRFLPSVKGLFNLGYTQYSLTGMDVESYQATTGILYPLQEKWSVQVAAGVRRTETDFDPAKLIPFLGPLQLPTQTQKGWGGVGQASLSYKGEVTNGSFTAGRDIAPASGLNGTVERTSFTFSADRRFSYEFRGLFSASYFVNKSNAGEFSPTAIDYQTFNVTPGVRYEFNRDMFLEASYTYTKYENRQRQANTTADRNLFLVRFFVQHPILE